MCFLRRAIYGLKQSLRAWFAKLSGLLSSYGFTSCIVDHTVLINKTQGDIVILVVYVDDVLLTGSDDTNIYATKTYLQQHLSILDFGVHDTFLGLSLRIRTRSWL